MTFFIKVLNNVSPFNEIFMVIDILIVHKSQDSEISSTPLCINLYFNSVNLDPALKTDKTEKPTHAHTFVGKLLKRDSAFYSFIIQKNMHKMVYCTFDNDLYTVRTG